jgi:hypothetical protein
MSARRTRAGGALSPLLELVVQALEDSRERADEGRALRAFGELALKRVPSRGIFAPDEGDLYTEIDEIAKKYLDLATPRKAFFAATTAVEPFGTRDQIEAAANHLQTVYDQAYFYTGLAFGITLCDFAGRG